MNHDSIYRFADFEFNVAEAELVKDGTRIRLQEKPLHVLALLLENAGRVVTRQQIREALWPANVFVDFDRNVNTAVTKLREALSDSADQPRFIETLSRRGYRFIAPLQHVAHSPEPVGDRPAANGRVPAFTLLDSARRLRLGVSLAVVSLLAAVGVFLLVPFTGQSAQCPQRITVAVLPLRDVGGDAAQVVFSAGLTEELISQLARLDPERTGVIASTSVAKYRCSAKGVNEIGRELGAQFVLEGTVRRRGNRVRIATQLIRVSDQTQIWAETFEADEPDSLRAQSLLAGSVLRSVAKCLEPVLQAADFSRFGEMATWATRGRW